MRLPSRHLMAALLPLVWLTACSTLPEPAKVPTVASVDLPRFMGDWYVLASIPTFLEKESFAATESYRLNADGTIDTVFAQRKGSFTAPLKTYTPRGFVRDASNAVWGMQFIWPIKAEYLIAHLDESYTQAIIARTRRDYVWILARTPQLPEAELAQLIERVQKLGYDVSKLRRVPQNAPGN